MTTARVIKGLDVGEDQEPGGGFRGWDLAGEAFGFERGDEALGERVVVGVGAAAHAGGDAAGGEPSAESAAGVLDAAIAVVNQSWRRQLSHAGLPEGGQHEFGAEIIATVMGEPQTRAPQLQGGPDSHPPDTTAAEFWGEYDRPQR